MHILVIYYSQTGQLKKILTTLFEQNTDVEVDYVPIIPVKDFPFPWKAHQFFDAMPECVLQIPEEIHPLKIPNKQYDLVVLGHNPWFLSPCLPINSFLKSSQASILQNQKVLTVIGARNMWLNAQEKVKADLASLGALLVGNIVLVDPRPNLISVLTIIRWTFKGIKEKTRFLPEAGIPEEEIKRVKDYGSIIIQTLKSQQWPSLQEKLLAQKAVVVQPGLVVLEKRGITNFRKFAAKIIAKGKRGDSARKPLVTLFQRLLVVGVFILSPISNFTAWLSTQVNRKALAKKINYFQGVGFEKDSL